MSFSPAASAPWLAVVLQPGEVFSPHGNKTIHVYNWKEKKVCHIFDAGKYMYVDFSACGDGGGSDGDSGDDGVIVTLMVLSATSGAGGLGVGVYTAFSPDGKYA